MTYTCLTAWSYFSDLSAVDVTYHHDVEHSAIYLESYTLSYQLAADVGAAGPFRSFFFSSAAISR